MSILSLNSYEDLLAKSNYEIDQLKSCISHPEYDYILFNLVLGMNHLYEWFLKDKDVSEELKLKCIKNFNPFNTPYDVSSDFKVCRLG